MILNIDMEGDIPIYQQIRDQIMLGVVSGELKPGEQLPTVRQLAEDIGVNPMTVNRAYAVLKDEQVIMIDRRHGAKIHSKPIRKRALDEGFNQKMTILITEAYIKGILKKDLETYITHIIEQVYKEEQR